jgi:hypothetical protein
MADLPPDIMNMLSRGSNLPDEDEFEDFMEQVSTCARHHPLVACNFWFRP